MSDPILDIVTSISNVAHESLQQGFKMGKNEGLELAAKLIAEKWTAEPMAQRLVADIRALKVLQ